MKQIALRAASLLVIVTLLTALAPLPVFATAGGKSVTKVVVEAVSTTETARKEITSAQQIQRLLDLLPNKSQLSNPCMVTHEGAYAKVTVYNGASTKETWLFHDDGCAIDSAGKWYYTSREMYNLLFLLTGKKPDVYPFGDLPYRMAGGKAEAYTTFRGETVTGFYTLDGVNFSYNIAVGNKMIAQLEKIPETKALTGKTGFLLFTDKGRYAWYYPQTSGNELLDFATENNGFDVLRRPQWLVYMNPDKIESITFESMGGKNYTLGNATKEYSVSVETTNRGSIDQIATYLKSMTVKPEAKRYNEIVNFSTPASLYTMRIKFNNGIEHIVGGHMSGMIVCDTDTKRSIVYETTEEQIQALRDFMSLLPEAKVKEF